MRAGDKLPHMTEWRLVFSAARSPAWVIAVVLAIVIAGGLFASLRRYEARLVSPGVGRSLLALRILTLLTLLLTFLRPVLTKRTDIEQHGRVIVAFDASESMETADRHASKAEMLRWAQALGMVGNDQTSGLLESWIAAFDSGQQPDWTGAGASAGLPAADANTAGENSGKADHSELAALRRRQVDGVFAEIAAMPRTEFVRRLLQARPNDLLKKLQQTQSVDLRLFGLEESAVAADQLNEVLASDRADLRPDGTDAVSVLTSAVSEPGGATVSGIVLLSDGRQTAKGDAESEAARLGSLGIPIYCIPIGSRLTPRDLSIASLQVPQTVFLDDMAHVMATVTSTGYAGDQVTVHLQRDGKTIDSRNINVAADHFDVEFEIPATEVGHHSYSLATDVQPGELREDNNSREFTVSVIDNKSRVLLVEGDARWEFRYLNSALERDKRVDLTTVLFDQPFIRMLNDTFIGHELPSPELLKEQLSNTDILILGDVAPEDISDTAWDAIDRAVEEDGVTLLLIPGRRHLPHAYRSPVLQRLSPVSDPRQQLAERYRRSARDGTPSAFRLHVTPDAHDLTLFRLTSADDERQSDFAGLPGHPWAYSGTPSPGATVWAELSMESADVGDLPVIVHQYYGFGQVVWMGIDSTWRWRFRAGDKWHHRFWGQLVRWAARNKSAAGNDQVRMTLSDVIVDDSESVEVAVRWNPQLVPQLADSVAEIVIEPQPDTAEASEVDSAPGTGQKTRRKDRTPPSPQTLVLNPVPGAPERLSTRISRLPPGSYKVNLNVTGGRLKLNTPITSQLIVQHQLSTELANISCNRPFLEQLAERSHGRVLEPWQANDLVELLQPPNQANSILHERTLWDHWTLLLLFFALLTTEWIIRKINGLP